MDPETKALTFVIPAITLVIVVLFAVGYLITSLLGLSPVLGEPLWLRFIGVPIVVVGFAQIAWLFRYRRFRNVLVSTFVTFKKLVKRSSLEERSERREPLVVAGPHKYVRHPLYFGVVVMVLGWAIVSNRTFVLLSTGILFAWFRLVIAPYEEIELKAIFGSEYVQYSKSVPSMIPFTRVRAKLRKRPS
jgi:protein-S-isoprenylcysteine O-methyltransferase Ste14